MATLTLNTAAARTTPAAHAGQFDSLLAFYDAVPVGLCVLDRTLHFVSVNRRMAAMIGRPAEAIIGCRMTDIAPAVAAQVAAPLRRALQGGRVTDLELSGAQADTICDGRAFLASFEPMIDNNGAVSNVLCSAIDITARKAAEAALRESEARLTRAIAAGRMSTWEWDLASDALQVSVGFDALFGRVPGSLQTMHAAMAALHPDDRGKVSAAIERALQSERDGDHEVEFRVVWPDGTERWVRAQGQAQRRATGELLGLVGVTHDITERKRSEERITFLAHCDPLTGLANRTLFRQRLEQVLAELDGRSGAMALLWLDFDNFKSVNDTLGHQAGDALLRQAAARLRRCAPESGLIARLGGDEFAVIQPGLCAPRDAAFLAQRMIDALGEPYEIGGMTVDAGVSIGIAIATGNDMTPDEIVKRADIALYRAKAEGRGLFRLFAPEMNEAIRRKQELAAGLYAALAHDALDLHFQPVVSLGTDGVTCLEALLRWRHPDRGPIPTPEIIAVAEEAGLIVPLGAWVLRRACREATRWPASVRVAVNLSPVQFRSPTLLRTVMHALEESGLAPGRLDLEITESALLQDDDVNLALLRRLREIDVRIVLDDFGTGFSSLGYLLRFPFDKIKIDRSFIEGLPDRQESQVIVRAVIGLGRNLGMEIVAEGVETEGQLRALRRKGCSQAQGYLFSHPVPAAEVPATIDRLRQR